MLAELIKLVSFEQYFLTHCLQWQGLIVVRSIVEHQIVIKKFTVKLLFHSNLSIL